MLQNDATFQNFNFLPLSSRNVSHFSSFTPSCFQKRSLDATLNKLQNSIFQRSTRMHKIASSANLVNLDRS